MPVRCWQRTTDGEKYNHIMMAMDTVLDVNGCSYKMPVGTPEEIAKLDVQGIIHNITTERDLEEAAGAYKNIDVVMANQSDLVNIVTRLTPVAVVKG